MPYVLYQQTSTPATADPSAADLGAQIRANVEQQLKAAGVSAKQAKTEAARAAKQATSYNIKTDAKGNVSVNVGDPGDADAQAPAAPNAPAAPVINTGTTSIPPDTPLDVPPRLENLGYALFLMIAVIAVGKPIARAFGGVIERRGIKPAMPPEFAGRLERIEQGIESVSIEIERISESQRYLLKVQSPAPEKAGLAQPRSAS